MEDDFLRSDIISQSSNFRWSRNSDQDETSNLKRLVLCLSGFGLSAARYQRCGALHFNLDQETFFGLSHSAHMLRNICCNENIE